MFGFSKRTSSPKANIRLPDAVLGCLQGLRVDLGTLEPLFEPARSNAYVFPCKGKAAPSLWEDLRTAMPSHGFWPAILGNDNDLVRHRESAPFLATQSPADILAKAASTNIPEFFRERHQLVLDPDIPDDQGPEDCEWPENAEGARPFFSCFDCLTDKAHPRVWIGLFPTADGCEVPAHLAFGDWNECPKPHEHVAVMKYWATCYGVELVSAASDIVELRSARRPAKREEALSLAREQFYYCMDNVDQGVGSIAALAKVLMENDFWYFWWD